MMAYHGRRILADSAHVISVTFTNPDGKPNDPVVSIAFRTDRVGGSMELTLNEAINLAIDINTAARPLTARALKRGDGQLAPPKQEGL